MTLKEHPLSGKKVLFIDDDLPLLQTMETVFSKIGCQVYTAPDGQTGLRLLFNHSPELVMLDLMLPGMDGWEVCRRIREFSTVPIIMLTGLGQDEDVINGLVGGADDYLVKPVAMRVLIAHAQAVLRRAALPLEVAPSFKYDDGYLTIDLSQPQVRVAGQLVQLSKTEYNLLVYLYRHTDQIRPHQQILADLWNLPDSRSVDVVHLNVWRLRQKLEVDSQNPRYLLTERGIGYRFQKNSAE